MGLVAVREGGFVRRVPLLEAGRGQPNVLLCGGCSFNCTFVDDVRCLTASIQGAFCGPAAVASFFFERGGWTNHFFVVARDYSLHIWHSAVTNFDGVFVEVLS